MASACVSVLVHTRTQVEQPPHIGRKASTDFAEGILEFPRKYLDEKRTEIRWDTNCLALSFSSARKGICAKNSDAQ